MAESFCANCGAALPDTARFCPNCGTARAATEVASVPPPPPPPPAYVPAPQPVATAPGYVALPPTNGFAIAALVCSLVAGCGIGSILGIVFGIIGRRQIDERGERGKGMATAGIVIGTIGLALLALWFLILVIAGSTDSGNY